MPLLCLFKEQCPAPSVWTEWTGHSPDLRGGCGLGRGETKTHGRHRALGAVGTWTWSDGSGGLPTGLTSRGILKDEQEPGKGMEGRGRVTGRRSNNLYVDRRHRRQRSEKSLSLFFLTYGAYRCTHSAQDSGPHQKLRITGDSVPQGNADPWVVSCGPVPSSSYCP